MGIYRFVLAALVVLFHFGGLSWIVGRIAVFAFYSISGFLIFQVLDRIYLDERRGVWRFFGNRCVRLIPLYLLYTVMTLAAVRLAGQPAFLDPFVRPVVASIDLGTAGLLWQSLTFEPSLTTSGLMPVLQFSPTLIPQGWSIGVEGSFYLIAPLVVATTRCRTWRLGLWIAGGLTAFLWAVRTSGVDLDQFQTVVYTNAIASAFVFFAGGAFYYLRRRWGQPLPFGFVLALLLAWLLVVTVPALDIGSGPPRSAAVFTEYLWLTCLLGALLALTQVRRLKALDTAGGNLCYGIYLNHFLVAALLLHAGTARYVGAPGTLSFGLTVLLGSAGLAFLTYRLLERPFDRLRARVRGHDVREATPHLQRVGRVRVTTVAVAAGLALAVNPIGSAVERLNGADTRAASPLSPPFDIRWKPTVTEAERLRLEADLGLTDGQPLLRDPRRRTWTYRLRLPTRNRVRAIVANAAVEDTGRIDTGRFEIPE